MEQQFNAGGNILDAICSSMSPDSIEVQACLDDWTKTQFWQQELEQEPTFKFFKKFQTTETEGSDD